MTPRTRSMSAIPTMLDSMEVPLHRARASLTWLIERAVTHPVTITRNGKAVAVVVHPSLVTSGDPLTSDLRSAVRADLLHALALLEAAK